MAYVPPFRRAGAQSAPMPSRPQPQTQVQQRQRFSRDKILRPAHVQLAERLVREQQLGTFGQLAPELETEIVHADDDSVGGASSDEDLLPDDDDMYQYDPETRSFKTHNTGYTMQTADIVLDPTIHMSDRCRERILDLYDAKFLKKYGRKTTQGPITVWESSHLVFVEAEQSTRAITIYYRYLRGIWRCNDGGVYMFNSAERCATFLGVSETDSANKFVHVGVGWRRTANIREQGIAESLYDFACVLLRPDQPPLLHVMTLCCAEKNKRTMHSMRGPLPRHLEERPNSAGLNGKRLFTFVEFNVMDPLQIHERVLRAVKQWHPQAQLMDFKQTNLIHKEQCVMMTIARAPDVRVDTASPFAPCAGDVVLSIANDPDSPWTELVLAEYIPAPDTQATPEQPALLLSEIRCIVQAVKFKSRAASIVVGPSFRSAPDGVVRQLCATDNRRSTRNCFELTERPEAPYCAVTAHDDGALAQQKAFLALFAEHVRLDLWKAVHTGSVALVQSVLDSIPPDALPDIINAHEPYGDYTPMIYACKDGFLDIAKLLHAHGALPNVKRKGMTSNALHYAIVYRRTEIVEWLVSNRLALGLPIDERTDQHVLDMRFEPLFAIWDKYLPDRQIRLRRSMQHVSKHR